MLKKHLTQLGYAFISLLSLGIAIPNAAAGTSDQEIAAIQQRIKARGAHWVAKQNSFTALSESEKQKRFGALQGIPSGTASLTVGGTSGGTSGGTTAVTVPATLDWRSYNGMSYVSPVKNQGGCGSCWAFSATATLESNVLLSQGTLVDDAEQIVLSCSGAGSCNGGSMQGAASFIAGTGVAGESFFPYTATDQPCSNAASGWQNYADKITQAITVANSVSAYETAIATYGPIMGSFDVYTDFDAYAGGVYQHTGGTFRGGHAIEIVGFDHANQYFIIKNSWGTGFGVGGFVLMSYNEFNTATSLGKYGTIAFYSSNAAPSLAVTSPAGGQSLSAGMTTNIAWAYTGSPGATVSISLWKGGAPYSVISSSTSIGSNGQGSFSWKIPSGQMPAGDYQVNVASIANGNLSSTSQAFTINPPPAPPAAPTGVAASLTTVKSGHGKKTTSTTAVKVSFQAVTSQAGISYYTILRDGAALVNTGATSYTDMGTSTGHTYTYTVIAVDSLGQQSPAELGSHRLEVIDRHGAWI